MRFFLIIMLIIHKISMSIEEYAFMSAPERPMKIQRNPNADYALDCVENALDLRWTIILRIILRII